jgi:hypothetical protein
MLKLNLPDYPKKTKARLMEKLRYELKAKINNSSSSDCVTMIRI